MVGKIAAALVLVAVTAVGALWGWQWFAGLGGASGVMVPDQRPFMQPDPRLWDAFLKEVVSDEGLVDYVRATGTAHGHLRAYLEQAAKATPAQFSSDAARLAFLINAYNASVIEGVLRRWPMASIEEAGPLHQFFRDRDYVIAGQTVSLHGLETKLIRPLDPRIHYALNCASRSCPPLRPEAYVADRLEAQLSEAEAAFLNNQRYNRYDPQRRVWQLSSIFKWYLADFGGETGLRGLLRRHGSRDAAPDAVIHYVPYDWRLNDVQQGALPLIPRAGETPALTE